MKGSRLYFIIIAIVLVLLILLQLRLPRNFRWMETYDTTDPEPFGCFAFDSLMRQSMPHGYTVSAKKLADIERSAKLKPVNILMPSSALALSLDDAAALKRMITGGSKVIIATGRTADLKTDSILGHDYSIGICKYSYSSVDNTYQQLRDLQESPHDTVYWIAPPRQDTKLLNRVFNFMTPSYLIHDTAEHFDTLAYIRNRIDGSFACEDYFPSNADSLEQLRRQLKAEGESTDLAISTYDDYYEVDSIEPIRHAVCLRRNIGKGSLIVVAEPKLFTNYGMLSRTTSALSRAVLEEITDRPIVRADRYCGIDRNYGDELVAQKSPTDYLLSQPALRLALRLAAALIVVFIVFKSRRRQRAIPVYTPPRNHTLEFTQLIGSLYYQRHDNADLVRKKFQSFAEALRRTLDIDIASVSDDENSIQQLCRSTGMTPHEAQRLILRLRTMALTEGRIADADMKRAIDDMNRTLARVEEGNTML